MAWKSGLLAIAVLIGWTIAPQGANAGPLDNVTSAVSEAQPPADAENSDELFVSHGAYHGGGWHGGWRGGYAGYRGWGWGWGYRPYAFYRPFYYSYYRPFAFGYYRPFYSYYYAPPLYYYPPYTYYYGPSYYYYSSVAPTRVAITLAAVPSVVPTPAPANGGGNYFYDGGPANPVPMPGRNTEKLPVAPTPTPAPADAISFTAGAPKKVTYTAYGETPARPTPPVRVVIQK